MATSFAVEGTRYVPRRGLFVVKGTVLDGAPQTGMTATLEGAEDAFSRTVHGIEVLDFGDDDGPRPCLTFHCRDARRAEEWSALEWDGKTLDLIW